MKKQRENVEKFKSKRRIKKQDFMGGSKSFSFD
jgi:hypothetical protein